MTPPSSGTDVTTPTNLGEFMYVYLCVCFLCVCVCVCVSQLFGEVLTLEKQNLIFSNYCIFILVFLAS